MKNMIIIIFSFISMIGNCKERETNLKNLYIQEIDTELKLESWMLDEYMWNQIDNVKDDTLRIESWMLDEKIWKK